MSKNSIYLIGLICWSVLFANANETDWTAQFAEANTAYESEKYAMAAQQYEAIIAEGYATAALFYNAGNAFYQKKEAGKAVLYYEKAKKLAPRDVAITQNLDLAQAMISNAISEPPMIFYKQWQQNIRNLMGSTLWGLFCLVFLGITAYGIWLFVVEQQRRKKQYGFLATLLGGLLTLFCLVFAFQKYADETNDFQVIVMIEEARLYTGPSEASKSTTELSAGLKINILDEVEEWTKVQLLDETEGWVKKEIFERI